MLIYTAKTRVADPIFSGMITISGVSFGVYGEDLATRFRELSLQLVQGLDDSMVPLELKPLGRGEVVLKRYHDWKACIAAHLLLIPGAHMLPWRKAFATHQQEKLCIGGTA